MVRVLVGYLGTGTWVRYLVRYLAGTGYRYGYGGYLVRWYGCSVGRGGCGGWAVAARLEMRFRSLRVVAVLTLGG